MAATTIDELKVLITAQSDKFNREIAKVQQHIKAMDDSTSKANKNMSAAFTGMAAKVAALGAAVYAAGKIIADSSKNFGALEQNLGGAGVVFGEFADTVKQKAQESAAAMGTSASQYLATANKMGSLFQGTGATVENSVAMTTQAMQRAIDVATAMGVSVEWALESVAGMAKGNFTMMDNLGVAMNDTNIAAFLLEKGIQANVNTMTTAQKVGFAYQMFMERTAKFAGNFTRELSTQEGALARARAEFGNLSELLGSAFAPIIISVANFATNYLIPALQAVIPYVVAVMQIIGKMVSFVTNALSSLFGGGSKDAGALKKDADKTADSVANIGSKASGAASGLNDAAGAAKKLKGQLAGFDEMNVLQQPSGGSGAGAGGGGAALPSFTVPKAEWENPLDSIGKKAQEVAAKIKKALEPVIEFFKMVGKAIWEIIPDWVKVALIEFGDLLKTIFSNPIVQEFLGYFVLALGTVAAIVGVAIVAFKVLGVVIAAVTSPIGLVIIAIAALIAAVILVIKYWDTIKETAGKVWDWIKDKTMELVDAVSSYFEGMWEDIVDTFNGVAGWFGDRFSQAWNAIKTAFSMYIGFYRALWDGTVAIFSVAGRWFGDTFSGAWEAIKRSFSTVGSFFRGVWDTIKGIFTTIGSTIGDAIGGAFKTVVNSVIGFAERTFNGFIRSINAAINVINKIPGVSITRLAELSVPKLATGGIATRATLAVFGEAGREAVLPLDRNTGWMDELAAKIGGGGQPIHLVVKIGEDTIKDIVIGGVNDEAYMRNENVLTI